LSETRRLDDQPELEEQVDVTYMQDVRERADAMFASFEDTPVIDASDKPRGHKASGAP
jgi:hypothetical protein